MRMTSYIPGMKMVFQTHEIDRTGVDAANQQASEYNRLAGMAGTGQVVANDMNTQGLQSTGQMANTINTTGQQIGQDKASREADYLREMQRGEQLEDTVKLGLLAVAFVVAWLLVLWGGGQ